MERLYARKSDPSKMGSLDAPLYVIPAKAGIQLFFSGFLLAQE
jgi:hypothetical protein